MIEFYSERKCPYKDCVYRNKHSKDFSCDYAGKKGRTKLAQKAVISKYIAINGEDCYFYELREGRTNW